MKMDNLLNKEDQGWIQTYTCKKFYPLNPNMDDVCIEDIAHALSNQCRFTGHSNSFYSIAQHSVLVSYLCDHKDALYGLLHDASEAYICDLSSPLKRSGLFENYKNFEKTLQSIIYKKFGLSEQEPVSVKEADVRMLYTEARDLFNEIHLDWEWIKEPYPFKIEALPPGESKDLFLNRFKELFNK